VYWSHDSQTPTSWYAGDVPYLLARLDALTETLREADHARELIGSQICQDDAAGDTTPFDIVSAYFVLRDALAALASPEKEPTP